MPIISENTIPIYEIERYAYFSIDLSKIVSGSLEGRFSLWEHKPQTSAITVLQLQSFLDPFHALGETEKGGILGLYRHVIKK